MAAADGLLYVAGGDQVSFGLKFLIVFIKITFFVQTCEVNFYRAQITISSVEVYDPLNDVWRSCIDLPSSRSEAGAVVL